MTLTDADIAREVLAANGHLRESPELARHAVAGWLGDKVIHAHEFDRDRWREIRDSRISGITAALMDLVRPVVRDLTVAPPPAPGPAPAPAARGPVPLDPYGDADPYEAERIARMSSDEFLAYRAGLKYAKHGEGLYEQWR